MISDQKPEALCLDCGCPMGTDAEYNWTSHEKSVCISLLLARAEAAEAKVEECRIPEQEADDAQR